MPTIPRLEHLKITPSESYKYIIPLKMRQQRDQFELGLKQRRLDLYERELNQEAEQRAEDFKNEAQKAKVNYMMDMYKSAVKEGNEGVAKSFGTQLQDLGFPVATERLQGPQEASGALPMRFLVNEKDQSKEYAPKYHFETDDKGNISVFKDGNLIKGSGKGKTKTETGSAGKTETEKENAIRKELTRLEGIKRQSEKTGGVSDVMFAMIAESNPDLAKKMQQNPEDAFIELDNYMESLKEQLPEGAKGKPTRWVIENGQFIKK